MKTFLHKPLVLIVLSIIILAIAFFAALISMSEKGIPMAPGKNYSFEKQV